MVWRSDTHAKSVANSVSATSPAACASRSRKTEEKSAMNRQNAAEVKNDCTSVYEIRGIKRKVFSSWY